MKNLSLDKGQIIDLLEITPPFLMIDHIKEIKPGKTAYGIKKLSQDEWFFQCHLKNEGTMPGVLQIEAMLQTLVLTLYTMDEHKGKLAYIQNISTKLIIKLLCNYNSNTEMIFMVQKEVAYKMNYKTNKKNNKLKLIVEATSNLKIIHNLSNKVFYPKPKVQSSIIKIIPKNNAELNLEKLLSFTKEIFKNKRKKIKNILKLNLIDKKFIKLINNRAEDLKTNELLYLFNKF